MICRNDEEATERSHLSSGVFEPYMTRRAVEIVFVAVGTDEVVGLLARGAGSGI